MKIDSLRKRYIYKLLSNLVGFIISLATAGIVPRALGVSNYGNFNFTTSIVTQILNLIEFRTSTCFYTKYSQRSKDVNLLTFYLYVIIGVLILVFSLLSLFTFSGLRKYIFPDQNSAIILFSFLFASLTWLQDFFIKILDAKAETIFLERMRMLNKVIATALILYLFYFQKITLTIYFFYQYFVILSFLLIIWIFLERNGTYFRLFPILSKDNIKKYFKEFYEYSTPLGMYVFFQFLLVTFDRWVLQVYGGSFEQGLYSFAFAFTNMSFLFVSAMIPLFTRELSVAVGERNLEQMAYLFKKIVPMLYAITAYFCCFVFIEIDTIIQIFGGNDYLNAKLAFMVLAFYPLVSVYSNLNGSVIYANGKTRIFFILGIFLTPLSIILSYILISKTNIGYNLGAFGLSIKNIVTELISVVIILYINAKYLSINFWKYLSHMIFSIIPFLLLAVFSKLIIGYFTISNNISVVFFLTGFLYTIMVTILAVMSPIILGVKKEDLRFLYKKIGLNK